MTDTAVTLRRADDDGLGYVESLLARNDLPSADVRSKPDCFYVGYDGETRIGVGGIEQFGTAGLLRSLVVERSVRGDGAGEALCAVLEAEAQSDGVETLFLLTTTASDFFAGRGYVEIERADVPDAVQRTAEFTDLCPEKAACMRKAL